MNFEWSKANVYRVAPLQPLRLHDTIVGEVKEGGGMTFVTIKEAGHMVPYDAPKVSYLMIKQWFKAF